MATVRELLVRLGVRADVGIVKQFDAALDGISTTARRVAGALTLVGAGVAGLAVKASGLAGNLEASRLTMRILVGDAAKAEELMGRLIDNAARTPFAQADVIEASKRLLRLTGENIDANIELLGVMETMAALNPSKNVVDAAEALLDATSGGGFERLKEFGITLRAEQFDFATTDPRFAAAVQERVAAIVSERTRGEDLVGALSTTFTGRLSTFRDGVLNVLTQIGEAINEVFGPVLDRAASFVQRNEARIVGAFRRVLYGARALGRQVVPAFEAILDGISRVPQPLLDIAAAATLATAAIAPLIVAGGSLVYVLGPLVSGIASLLGAIGGLLGVSSLSVLAIVIAGLVSTVAAMAAPWLALAAAVGAVYLAIDEFLVTLRGGDSIMRRFTDWFGVGEQVVNSWRSTIVDLNATLRAFRTIAGAVGADLYETVEPAINAVAYAAQVAYGPIEKLLGVLERLSDIGFDAIAGALGVVNRPYEQGARGLRQLAESAAERYAPGPATLNAGAGGTTNSTAKNFGDVNIYGTRLDNREVEATARRIHEQRRRMVAANSAGGEL